MGITADHDKQGRLIEWRDSLLGSDREHLNNPIDIWERFNKDDRKPREGGRQRPKRMRHKEQNNLLDQLEALGALVESLKDRLSMAETTIHEIAPQLTAERASDISPLRYGSFTRICRTTCKTLCTIGWNERGLFGPFSFGLSVVNRRSLNFYMCKNAEVRYSTYR